MQKKKNRPSEKQKSETLKTVLDLICGRLQAYSAKTNRSDSRISLEIGKDASYLNKLYTKGFIPSLQALCDICDYFGVSVVEFLHPSGQIEQAMRSVLQEADILLLIQMIQEYPQVASDILRGLLVLYEQRPTKKQ